MEQNIQERSPNTDGALECDISDGVIQQTNEHNEGTGELNPPIVLTHGPSDLSSLLLKYSLSNSDIDRKCDDMLFQTLLPQMSNIHDTAPCFGFTQQEIEEIQIDKPSERSRKLSLLWKWRSRNGSDATYLAIVDVFLRMKDQNLAEIVLQHVKGMFQHQSQPIGSYVYPERVNSYDNWERKSAAEKEQIKNRLYSQNQDIRGKYSFLIQNIIDSFEKRNIKVQRLKIFLDTYGSMPLSQFESASDLVDVFSVLCRYYSSWFNIRLLKAIVNEKRFGSDEDRKETEIYEDELLVYLQRSLFEIPSKSFAPGHQNAGLIPLFLLLPNDIVPTGEDVKNITRNLSQLLDISGGILQFLGFEDCSILLIFGVPEQLFHINALQSLIEKYFTYDVTRKGYTINDLALILPPGLYDNSSGLKRSQIQLTESIVMEDVTLASSTAKLKDSQDYYKKAFQDAVKKRDPLCTYMAHCLAFGPLGSGKTSLLHRLIDKPLGTLATRDKSSSSSRSDEMMVPKYIIATGGKWYQIPNLEEVAVKLAEFAANPLSVPIPLNILLEAYGTQSMQSVNLVSDGTNPTASLRYDKILDSIRDSKFLDNSTVITYIDHGSQPEFQEMVPVLLAGPAIYLFIFSLAEGLDSKYTASYGSSDSERHLYKSPFTVKEVFMQFLSSIASYHSVLSLKSRVSPLSILVVGTHKNLVNKAKVSEIDEELKQAVEEASLHKSGAIEYFSKEQLIIPVDNYNDNNDSASVRNVVERIVKKHGSPYRIEFPIPWLALDFTLRKCPPTVTYKECTEIAKNYDISEKDLPKCLLFLHHEIGSIRYYDSVKELKDIVVTRPTVIFEAISGLIINTFTSENVPTTQFKKFRNLGLLERDTIENIFARHKEMLKISCDAFIALLFHFNILESSHDPELGDYFFPCALVRAPNPPEVNLDPLLVLFKGGSVPKGVFSALLVFLLREMKWRIQRDKGLPLLYRNQASFDNGKDCFITLKAAAKCLEVLVVGKQGGSTTKSLYKIHQILEEGVFNACKSLRYDQSFYSRQFGFYCNLPKCARHIAEVDLKNKEIVCALTKKKYPVNSDREYWFTDKPEEVKTVSQSPTSKRHGRPTITLQRTVSRGSEKTKSEEETKHEVQEKGKTEASVRIIIEDLSWLIIISFVMIIIAIIVYNIFS